MAATFQFGIAEEYFLVDAETKSVAAPMTERFLSAARSATAGQIKGEVNQPRVEVATAPHVEIVRAREELRHLRQTMGLIAAKHKLAILAAGTHPTATSVNQPDLSQERHGLAMADAQLLGHRSMLCGLHVYVEVPNPDDRVDVMVRMLPYLPLLVALATSSPFWQSRQTGLKGYRLAAQDELPRTGVPELFRTLGEYEAYVAALKRAGLIGDSSHIWWAIRPSLRRPTLELRAPDCCTRVEDSIAVAALYRALVRRLTYNPWLHWDLTAVSRALVVENKWRAQRFGVAATFVDEVNGPVSVVEQLAQVISEVRRDAEALGCLAEVEHCRTIAGSGSSADAQIAVFEAAKGKSRNERDALSAVTNWIATATLQ